MTKSMTPDVNDEQLQMKIDDLYQTIHNGWDQTDIGVEGETIDEKFKKIHNVTITEYLDTVRLFAELGMTFSAARTYAIEMFSKHAVLGTNYYTEYQAKITGVSEKAYKQLLNEAEDQINEIIRLRYSITSDRPLEVIATHDIVGFSDYEKGEYSTEMNPSHHRMVVYVCKYILEPETDEEYAHSRKYEDSTLPKYAVFFEKYTGNGIVDESRNLDEQGSRLHSIETAYCQNIDEVEQAIWSKLKYDNRKNELERLMDKINS